jgi:mono/diheme cytochrome c family protein
MMHTKETFYTGLVKLFIGLIVILLINGCGAGNGEGLDQNGNLLTDDAGDDTPADTGGDTGGDGGGATSGNPNATLDWVQTNVFGGVCTICHGGAAPQRDLNWSSETETCSNVGKTSTWDASMNEIESGNPDASFVIWKLEGDLLPTNGDLGDQMPLGMTPLSTEEIQNIRDWISDGTPGCATPKPSGTANTSISWKQVWEDSLQTCVACHSIEPASPACSTDFDCPPNGLVLTGDNYLGVIGGSTVSPFDPEGSSLWQSLNSSDHLDLIPLGYAVLSQNQIDIVHQWVEGGAPFCPEDQACQ